MHQRRSIFALRGIAALIFGALTLVWPGLTLTVVVLLFGAYALVEGISIIANEFQIPAGFRRPVAFVEGGAGVAAGIITFVWPGITALALLWVIALWLAVTGVLEVEQAITRRHDLRGPWLLGLIGALSVVAAVILVVAPVEGALAITWSIWWFAIAAGVAFLVMAAQAQSAASPVRNVGGDARHATTA
jgi:uncharacterized membrane protein HdeD (DUF308 family)